MNHYEGDNIGSLLSAEIAHHTDFDNFNPAVFKAGKSWIKIPFKEESGSFKGGNEDSDNGQIYSYDGEFFIHRIREEVRTELHPFLGQHGVLRLTDLNGEVYIIGAPGMSVTLTVSAGTAEKYAGENGSLFSFAISQPFEYLKA
ncbi:hypothetical protein OQZ33_04345 [Pedobacter sp. MC2016-05]|uniref:hypothetical protein n=1 Tax=Pedobacter sp. MC2016-05 TaxID=2994474 RepID=UPI002245B99A|nr:hypothetical protein [Pedobacter sp. MC2016-05]MCX2473556.1 hypothetical protein [Pedobacter sp. MC2016-05]